MDNNIPTPITYRFLYTFYGERQRPHRVVKYVFWFLRKNMHLTEQEDYNRLYEEVLEFQINEAVKHCDWKAEDVEENRKDMEFLSDLFSSHPDEEYKLFTREDLDEFLELRREFVWK